MEYGLIGEKLGHSFSKIIHERLTDYTYELTPLSKELLHRFMLEKNFKAINVTIPYKETVMPYLDSIGPKAAAIGAVNTVVNKNGKLYGYNTDYDGFRYMLCRHGIDPKGKKVLLLGKGGAAKACKAVLEDMGAADILTVYYKTAPDTITYEECYSHHKDAAIIVNTTPVGMYPDNDGCPVSLDSFSSLEAVCDVVYNPLRTRLVLEGINKGVTSTGGLEMLIGQAKFAAEIFLEKKLDTTAIENLITSMYADRTNLVLIGMSGCGKTTLGRLAAEKLHRTFVDIDEEITKRIAMPITQYFSKMGEPAFRKLETELVKELSSQTGIVISTGGGVIKNWDNIMALKQNGRIVWIDRKPSALEYGNGRPLAPDTEAAQRLYFERLPLYSKAAEAVADNNGTTDEGLSNIISGFFSL